MTGTDIVPASQYSRYSLAAKREYVEMIARSGDLLPQSLWTKPRPNPNGGGMIPAAPSPEKVLLLAETGDMLGLHPIAALQSIHIIEGKPTLSANIMSALVRDRGHKLRVTTKGSWAEGTFVATAVIIRKDDPDFEFSVEWSKERAQRAGLLSKKGAWQSYPEAMCKARAISEVIREGAADALMGLGAYVPEELGAANVDQDGEPIELTQVHANGAQPQREQPRMEDMPPVVEEERRDARTNWQEAVQTIKTIEDARGAYRRASSDGELDTLIEMVNAEPMKLSDLLAKMAEGFAAAASAPQESAPEPDQDEAPEGEPVDEESGDAPMALGGE